jgi:hypothetical protein
MAYLRPLNSSEANLFVIRFTSPLVTNNKLTALSGSLTGYYVVNTSSYTTPTSDLLPSGFRFMIGNSAKKDYMIEFGTMNNPFTEPPTVTITMNKKDITDVDINKYKVFLTDVTVSTLNFIVVDNDTNLPITPYTDASNIKCPIFNILVVGSVMSGATFAISNRGWNVPESAVNKLYTYQSVGIGTGKVDGTLNLVGTFVTPAYIVSYSESDDIDTIAKNIVTSTLTLLTIPTSLTATRKINLPNGKNGQTIRLSLTNDSFDDPGDTNKLYVDGSCLNTGNDFVLAQDSHILKMTELYYDETISPAKWIVINYSII